MSADNPEILENKFLKKWFSKLLFIFFFLIAAPILLYFAEVGNYINPPGDIYVYFLVLILLYTIFLLVITDLFSTIELHPNKIVYKHLFSSSSPLEIQFSDIYGVNDYGVVESLEGKYYLPLGFDKESKKRLKERVVRHFSEEGYPIEEFKGWILRTDKLTPERMAKLIRGGLLEKYEITVRSTNRSLMDYSKIVFSIASFILLGYMFLVVALVLLAFLFSKVSVVWLTMLLMVTSPIPIVFMFLRQRMKINRPYTLKISPTGIILEREGERPKEIGWKSIKRVSCKWYSEGLPYIIKIYHRKGREKISLSNLSKGDAYMASAVFLKYCREYSIPVK